MLESQTQKLDLSRHALEGNLKELTDQLKKLREFTVDGDMEQLQEIKSLQQAVGENNSLLKEFEKMTLGNSKMIWR